MTVLRVCVDIPDDWPLLLLLARPGVGLGVSLVSVTWEPSARVLVTMVVIIWASVDEGLWGLVVDSGGSVGDADEDVELDVWSVSDDEELEVELDEVVVGGSFVDVLELVRVVVEEVCSVAVGVVFGGGVVVAPASVFAFSSFCLC